MPFCEQLLLVQDGKLYGRDPMFGVIIKAAALPDAMKDHDVQKNVYIVQLGKVKIIVFLFVLFISLIFKFAQFFDFVCVCGWHEEAFTGWG